VLAELPCTSEDYLMSVPRFVVKCKGFVVVYFATG
jgi:hypothetical protein